MPSNPWSAVDDLVLGTFRDGQPRTARDVYGELPGIPRREITKSLDVYAQHGWLAAGELTYVITEAGKRHLATTKELV
jgi:uncharacterized protein YpbB